jgi:uncharacterized protein YggE
MRSIREVFVFVAAVAFIGGFAHTAAHAQAPDLGHERLLTVTGEGTAVGAPDIALLILGVVSDAPAARDALATNNESMAKILAALKQAGIEGRDLQTAGFSVEPVYSQPPASGDNSQPFEPKIVSYRVRNNVTVRVRALANIGTILDQAVTLGANSISGPTFTVDDPKKLQDQARSEAVADALRKGKLIATAAGTPLGPIFRIEEGYSQPPQPVDSGAMMRLEAAPSVPIEGGEMNFQSQVSISWRLAE